MDRDFGGRPGAIEALLAILEFIIPFAKCTGQSLEVPIEVLVAGLADLDRGQSLPSSRKRPRNTGHAHRPQKTFAVQLERRPSFCGEVALTYSMLAIVSLSGSVGRDIAHMGTRTELPVQQCGTGAAFRARTVIAAA